MHGPFPKHAISDALRVSVLIDALGLNGAVGGELAWYVPGPLIVCGEICLQLMFYNTCKKLADMIEEQPNFVYIDRLNYGDYIAAYFRKPYATH